jgi:DNA-binding transcriptional ArsR family regulator
LPILDRSPPVPDSTLRLASYMSAMTLLSFLQAVAMARFRGELGPHMMTILLGAVLFIGQHQGRPFTAAKLAQYVRIPRQTVTRRLDRMVEAGIVERRGTLYYVRDDYLDGPEAAGLVRELVQIINSACNQLPKMSNNPLDKL